MKIKPFLLQHLLIFLSILSFVGCLFFNTIKIIDINSPATAGYSHPGYYMLVLGIFGLMVGQLSWLANPMLIGAWIAIIFRKMALGTFLSWMALFFALLFLATPEIIVDFGYTKEIIGYGIGYWLWLFSMALAILSTAQSRSKLVIFSFAVISILIFAWAGSDIIFNQDKLLINKAQEIAINDNMVVQQVGKITSVSMVHGVYEFNKMPAMLTFKVIGPVFTIDVVVEVSGSRFNPKFMHFISGEKMLNR